MMKRYAVEFICAFIMDGIVCILRTAAHSGKLICISAFLGVNYQFINIANLILF
jgi:hypothetical protein